MTEEWTLNRMAKAIRERRISPKELTKQCLDKIEASPLHAFTYVDRDQALKTAELLESELLRNKIRGPLHGVPVGYKDLFYIYGMPTYCGTSRPDYWVAGSTATAVMGLAAAGAIAVGKLNMTELAMSPFGENRFHGDVKNPWSADFCPGGSSSGSSAAVAAGLVLGALGSDTAGSIRLPAAYCGVVGLKPTYGLVSNLGAMPLSWSHDHVGPIARTVRDTALLLESIVSSRPNRNAAVGKVNYADLLDQPLPTIRLGVPKNYYWDGIDADLEAAIRGAIESLARLGVRLVDLELPYQDAINNISSLMTRAEASAAHGAFAKQHPDALAPAIVSRLEIGYQIHAYDYLQAQRLRSKLTREFIDQIFGQVDMFIAPVAPGVAPRSADLTTGHVRVILDQMARLAKLTRPANGFGLPAVAVPCGFSTAGLPFAFQLVGRPFDEGSILQVAHRYEQSFEWWKRTPT
jgi:aspartyl-tRNA(Asn)/glutamyl-tRNA(Gln) amidotransferase subunit A